MSVRANYKLCTCSECAKALRADKARQDAAIWAKVSPKGLTYQQRAYRASKVNA